jgi:choline dehydrogenase
MNIMDAFDYVIVGAGTAGSLLANRLSADPKNSVLLLEAGGKDDWIWIHIPVGYLYCIGNPRTDWCYKTEPDPGLNGRSILYARGRVLGGSSSINAMLYLRGQQCDYDEWARQSGDSGWSWQNVLPVFKHSEDHWRGADAFHGAKESGDDRAGAGHEWRVERQRLSWEILDAFRDAALEAGIAKVDDFNRGDNAGSSKFEVNQRSGVRVSASKAFLRPALGRPNLTVVTGAQVKRLRLEGRRVLGVEFFQGNEESYAAARRETILAAGSIGSPQILQLSGIGPGALLQALNIPVALDNPNTGTHLQDHLGLNYTFRSKLPTINGQLHPWWGKLFEGAKYLLLRRGPLSLSLNQAGGFFRTSPDLARPNMQIYFQAISTITARKGSRPIHNPDPFEAFSLGLSNCRPTSRGSIMIGARDASQPPRITANAFATEHDRAEMLAGVKFLRKLAEMPSLAAVIAEELAPGPSCVSDADLLADTAKRSGTVYHPVGTCRMGPDAAGAVVDARLRVHGIGGLRVIDASIMPNIVSGNTNAAAIMIGAKGADMVIEDAR